MQPVSLPQGGRDVVSFYHQYIGFYFFCQPKILVLWVKMKTESTSDKPLKKLIEQQGFTQKSFARALGKAYSTVQYYVAGEAMPTVQVFADMCRVLDQSPKTVMTALGINTVGIPDDSPN
jgi:hypothetical protein